MDPEARKKQQNIIRAVIEGIDNKVKKAVDLKTQLRNALADIENKKAVFLPAEIEKLINAAQSDYSSKLGSIGQEVNKSLDDLSLLINERDSELDLNNPALTNALNLIQTVGQQLPYETILKINENFSFDQPSLRVLQAAYKAANITGTGNLDEMIYSPGELIENMKKWVDLTFNQDGSLNHFSTQFSKIAFFEGQRVTLTPDEEGVYAAMRHGAGIS
jgi:hypothetical protein